MVDVAGTPDHLDFLAPRVGAGSLGEVRRQHLELTAEGRLELSSTGLHAAASDAAETDVLLRHAASLQLSYFGAAAPDGARTWRSAWSQSGAPPELIRVRVAFVPGDRRSWPELIARPGATVDSQCVLDPASGGCRGRG